MPPTLPSEHAIKALHGLDGFGVIGLYILVLGCILLVVIPLVISFKLKQAVLKEKNSAELIVLKEKSSESQRNSFQEIVKYFGDSIATMQKLTIESQNNNAEKIANAVSDLTEVVTQVRIELKEHVIKTEVTLTKHSDLHQEHKQIGREIRDEVKTVDLRVNKIEKDLLL